VSNEAANPGWDETYDVVVIGSGAAGMTAALTAATLGQRVLLAEKTAFFGGGCAVSGGVVWIPQNAPMAGLGLSDTTAAARQYLRKVVGDKARWDLIDAFLENGPAMLDFLHGQTSVRLVPRLVAPDYYAEEEGAATGGRMLDPAVFDGRTLGPLFARLRAPLPSFMLFGGMMVAKADIAALLKCHKSPAAFRHAIKLMFRYTLDRLRHPRGTRLVVGNALAATLLKAASQAGVTLQAEADAIDLIRDRGRVAGVALMHAGKLKRVQALRGLILATGGAPGDAEFARAHIPFSEHHYSMAPASNTGDGIRLGLAAGGRLDDVNRDNAFWTPVSLLQRKDGSLLKFAHLITDRQKPGLIAVNHAGRRFTNESASYHDFVAAMHAAQVREATIPAYLICDSRFIHRYGLGLVRPGPSPKAGYIRAGYLFKASSIAELARSLGVPPESLAGEVAANNHYAVTGVDADFARGSSAYQRYLGDPEWGPNPCIGPIAHAPFYAVKVFPGDIGTSLGLRTDPQARVLDAADRPIAGLYACGNDMNSVMAGTYPSGGITLGPAMTFGFLVARALAAGASFESAAPTTSPTAIRARAIHALA